MSYGQVICGVLKPAFTHANDAAKPLDFWILSFDRNSEERLICAI
jgi:hypothetical protein